MDLLISSVGSLVVPRLFTRSDKVLSVESKRFRVSDASSRVSIAELDGVHRESWSAKSFYKTPAELIILEHSSVYL